MCNCKSDCNVRSVVSHYGDGPVSVLRAPARIGIWVSIWCVSYLPTASLPFGSRGMTCSCSIAISDGQGARSFHLAALPPFSYSLAQGPAVNTSGDAEADWLSYLYEQPAKESHWANYIKGAVFFTRITGGARTLCGFDFVVDSSIPAGGGASSSSALVVLASAAMRDVNKLSYSPIVLARRAAKAEWYVGTRGGEMDHITMCMAQRGHAVLISYQDQQTRPVTLPGQQFRWITFFSHPADKGREVMI
jgi:hypothetical protein